MTALFGNTRNLIIFAFALSILGLALVLNTPFGGMTVRTFYGPRERYASLGSEYSEPLDNVFIILLSVCILAMALICFIVLISRTSRPLNQKKLIGPARLLAVITLCLAIAGGITYEITRAIIDYEDWWLDTGFYAGIVAGLLNTIVFSMILRKRE